MRGRIKTRVVSHPRDEFPSGTGQLAGEGRLGRALGPLTAQQGCGGRLLGRVVYRAISPEYVLANTSHMFFQLQRHASLYT